MDVVVVVVLSEHTQHFGSVWICISMECLILRAGLIRGTYVLLATAPFSAVMLPVDWKQKGRLIGKNLPLASSKFYLGKFRRLYSVQF